MGSQLLGLKHALGFLIVVHIITGSQEWLKFIPELHGFFRGVDAGVLGIPHILHYPEGVGTVSALQREHRRRPVGTEVIVIGGVSLYDLKFQSFVRFRRSRHIALGKG